MKAYIQTDQAGEFYNVNAYVAWVGFKTLGFEVHKFVAAADIHDLEPDAVLVGGVGMVRARLLALKCEIPAELEYPNQLADFLNRKIWKTKLNALIQTNKTNLFIKPVQTKLFQGKVIHELKDYLGLNFNGDPEVWCSEIVPIVTEWRCFIRYKKILDIRYYKGAWDQKLNLEKVQTMLDTYADQPAAFALDIGVDATGKHYLIEVNDGHSLGTYGIGSISYAKFLSARWAEMTNTTDYLNF